MRDNPERDSGNAWLKKRPEKQKAANRKAHLKHKHGTTIEQYEDAWHHQNGMCANKRCCASFPLDSGDYRSGALHVDHCHRTGAFRALLCPGCNVALGQIGESAARLRGLASYISERLLANG